MLSELLDLGAWAQWFAALDRQFIFLLALPFVVAIIGLWSWFTESEMDERESDATVPRAAEARPTRAAEAHPVERERRVRARRREDARPAHQT